MLKDEEPECTSYFAYDGLRLSSWILELKLKVSFDQ